MFMYLNYEHILLTLTSTPQIAARDVPKQNEEGTALFQDEEVVKKWGVLLGASLLFSVHGNRMTQRNTKHPNPFHIN